MVQPVSYAWHTGDTAQASWFTYVITKYQYCLLDMKYISYYIVTALFNIDDIN